MSDSLAQFIAKTEAMFANVESQQDQIVKTWVLQFVRYILVATPGPGNQDPPDTPYIATGRLRGAWALSVSQPPAETDRKDGGPYDESMDGSATIDRISAEVLSMELPPMLFVWNDVRYGYLIHEGLGHHQNPRPFVTMAASMTQTFLRNSQQSVMSRAS